MSATNLPRKGDGECLHAGRLETLDESLHAREYRVGAATRRLLERIGYAGDG